MIGWPRRCLASSPISPTIAPLNPQRSPINFPRLTAGATSNLLVQSECHGQAELATEREMRYLAPRSLVVTPSAESEVKGVYLNDQERYRSPSFHSSDCFASWVALWLGRCAASTANHRVNIRHGTGRSAQGSSMAPGWTVPWRGLDRGYRRRDPADGFLFRRHGGRGLEDDRRRYQLASGQRRLSFRHRLGRRDWFIGLRS